MKVSKEQAREFLDALNDYISNGDWTPEMVSLSYEQAHSMDRATMDKYLLEFMALAMIHLIK